MPKYRKDDKVVITAGPNKYRTGIVTDPQYMMEKSAAFEVEILLDIGRYAYEDEQYVEYSEDPYEYSLLFTKDGEIQPIPVNRWMSLGDAKGWLRGCASLELYNKTAKMVKRRKAGPVEDA